MLPLWTAITHSREHGKHRLDVEDCRQFDVSDVVELAVDLAKRSSKEDVPLLRAHLPSRKTWVEWRNPGVPEEEIPENFNGWMLESDDYWRCRAVLWSGVGNRALPVLEVDLDLEKAPSDRPMLRPFVSEQECSEPDFIPGTSLARAVLVGALALINSEKVTQHVEHRPSRQMRRAAERRPGSFPLRAWTEVKLRVGPEVHGQPTSGVLTGRRALHFCRAYTRIRFGKLELVSESWRGDASLGIVRSRYKVTENT